MLRISLLLALPLAFAASSVAAPAQCGTGSVTTTFADNNGQSGNMFDITPSVDLTIECLDINSRAIAGNTATILLYYKVGSSVGSEQNPAAWTFLGTYTGIAAGRHFATNIDVSGNGVTFLAGQTYGLYIDTPSDGIAYTNGGPNVYSNADLTVTTNCGNAANFGSIFYPREWNGTVYYSAGPGSPTLSVSGLVAGGSATLTASQCTPGGTVRWGYSLAGGGPVGTPFGNLLLSPPYTELPAKTTDPAGSASFSGPVPPGTTGISIWLHAFDLSSLTFTNGLAEIIG